METGRINAKGTVLVIDDEGDILELLRGSLQEEGFEVITCKSGGEALSVIKKRKIDCQLVDVLMPGMTGGEYLEKMKEEGFSIPTLIMTGLMETTEEIYGYYIVEKPFNLSKMIGKILRVVEESTEN